MQKDCAQVRIMSPCSRNLHSGFIVAKKENFLFSYLPDEIGTYTIEIIINGRYIQGCPFAWTVKELVIPSRKYTKMEDESDWIVQLRVNQEYRTMIGLYSISRCWRLPRNRWVPSLFIQRSVLTRNWTIDEQYFLFLHFDFNVPLLKQTNELTVAVRAACHLRASMLKHIAIKLLGKWSKKIFTYELIVK